MATPEVLAAAGLTNQGVSSVRDVAAAKFIVAYAAHLKKSNKLTIPEWVDIVKTSPNNELPPLDPDWYYVRSASIVRKIYLNGGIGVGALARWYGGVMSVKGRPEHFRPASRGLIRHILRNLQACSIVEETEKGGRRVTPEGQKELDTIARNA